MTRPTRCPDHATHRAGCTECRRFARENYRHYRPTELADRALHDVAPVRAHVRHLLDSGMRFLDVAADAGLASGHLNRIMYSKGTAHCFTATARRILAVRLRVDAGAIIDGVGVRRMMRALACRGWSQPAVGERAGYDASVGSNWAHARTVHRATRDVVGRVYAELSALDGPSVRAARLAQGRGWDPPEAWSDATIDDPKAEPFDWLRDDVDEVAVEQVERGERRFSALTRPEQRALVRRHIGKNAWPTLAGRWGTSRPRLEKLAAEIIGQAAA